MSFLYINNMNMTGDMIHRHDFYHIYSHSPSQMSLWLFCWTPFLPGWDYCHLDAKCRILRQWSVRCWYCHQWPCARWCPPAGTYVWHRALLASLGPQCPAHKGRSGCWWCGPHHPRWAHSQSAPNVLELKKRNLMMQQINNTVHR